MWRSSPTAVPRFDAGITAMMRAPDHKNFRDSGDRFLRYFCVDWQRASM
ncbi:hypothetical protein ACNKHP_21945 [Shigella boydii]